jgi:mannitol/fructose-specific phosphotransferase system IIA component (Ntr-type)
MSAFGIDINPDLICVIKGQPSKYDALEKLISVVAESPAITDREAFRRAVVDRESVMSTGIGGGIAIPHVRIPEVKFAVVGVAVAPEGLDFASLDNSPVHILVLFATPAGADKEYLSLLARVMLALKNQDLFDRLRGCHTPEEVFEVLKG